jgi:nucleotide-binding universal stress UspA family protein
MPVPIQRILIPTDLNPAGIDALRYARLLAGRFDAALTVFYVDPIVFPTEGFGVEGPMSVTATPEQTAYLENEVRGYAGAALAGVDYGVIIAGGQPVPVIVREAHDCGANLIVMSTHGAAGWRRAILGSVTQGVLHRGEVPVLSLRRGEQPRTTTAITTIVCPVNFTETANDALTYAAAFATAFGAQLIVVHVAEEQEIGHAAALRAWVDRRVTATYRELVLRGGAAERVLDFADDCGADLLVIGAQHRLFRDETVIGTTTERLVRFARMPVLTVPRPVATGTNELQSAAFTTA